MENDPGYFGIGFYFTSYIDYALLYQFAFTKLKTIQEIEKYILEKENGEFQIMLFLINLGNCEEMNQFPLKHPLKQFKGKHLPSQIDSRHVFVGRKKIRSINFLPSIIYPESDVTYDEYVVRDKFRTLPQVILKFKISSNKSQEIPNKEEIISNEFQKIPKMIIDQAQLKKQMS
jgi:hypothetical protein